MNYSPKLRMVKKWEETSWCNEKKVGLRIRSSGFVIHVQIAVALLTGYLILSKFFPYL